MGWGGGGGKLVGSPTGIQARRKRKEVELAMEICNLQMTAYELHHISLTYYILPFHVGNFLIMSLLYVFSICLTPVGGGVFKL